MQQTDLTKLSVAELIKVQESLATEKSTISQNLQEINDYVLPSKSAVNRQTVTPGERRGHERYDDTAVEANELLAASLGGTITSRAFQWAKLKLEEEDLNEFDEVRDWLDDCTNRLHGAFNASNFHTEMDECYLDLGGYGTTALGMPTKTLNQDGSFNGLLFQNWPIAEYTFLENADGVADTIFRRFKLRAYEAQQHFPGLSLGTSVNDAIKSDNQQKRFEQFEFVHCIYPRFGVDPSRPGQKNMPIGSKYIAVKDKFLIKESGFFELPAAIMRWRKASDDRGWGRGPGWTAMPTIRSLNTGRKLMLKAWAKDVDPAIIAEDKGVVGQIRNYASGVTYVRKNARLEHWQSQSKYDVSQFNVENMQRSIRQKFFADQLVPPQDREMTLGEFLKRMEIIQRLLGPVLGRIETDGLTPIIFRSFNIMLRTGAFKEPPQALIESVKQPTLAVEYVGPLSRAQRLQDVQAIERIYMQASVIAQAKGGDMSVFDNLDDDEAIQIAGPLEGVPGKVIRGKDELGKMRSARAQAMKQQQALNVAGQAAEVAKTAKQAQAL